VVAAARGQRLRHRHHPPEQQPFPLFTNPLSILTHRVWCDLTLLDLRVHVKSAMPRTAFLVMSILNS
jgi:hypothetical protein